MFDEKLFFKRNIITKKLWNIFHNYKITFCLVIIMALMYFEALCSQYISVPIVMCPFKAITGLPCPGCGGIRASQSILKGDFMSALQTNPLSCLFILFFIMMIFWSLYDGYKKQNTLLDFLTKKWNKYVILTCFIIILSNWIWNIYKGL